MNINTLTQEVSVLITRLVAGKICTRLLAVSRLQIYVIMFFSHRLTSADLCDNVTAGLQLVERQNVKEQTNR